MSAVVEPGDARLAVVGGGWAGLAAAVTARQRGWRVSLCEMAPHLGGRARTVSHGGLQLDNGQHILVGAYADTLALMRTVGVDPETVLLRLPLTLRTPDGAGLQLPTGPAVPAFVRGVLAWRDLPWLDRLGLLAVAARWRLSGFRCAPGTTVAQLARHCPRSAYTRLIEPLCVAALNTPADQASAQVLLNVLRDALFGAPGASDLLLPRAPLDALLPEAAGRWLHAHGVEVRLGHRVSRLEPDGPRWRVDGELHDAVVLACPPGEAGRLCDTVAPAWAARARALAYQPIVTTWLRAPGARWPCPMLALHSDATSPAQFGFDLGALGGPAGLYALVSSGAAAWVDAGADATRRAMLAQWQREFPSAAHAPVEWVAQRTEKRATFACTPGLDRPPAQVAPHLWAAGDHVAGPYPATLEGAVRAGMEAARQAVSGA
ncbi:hydroxysqualene dehydroxylase HpnE [Ideonella sp.]|uniref:hydroxysqualene dehydroxylase HpnE n=1 Tax=Ideonella sp. TaxID=1929293 RepID=UPI0035AF9D62